MLWISKTTSPHLVLHVVRFPNSHAIEHVNGPDHLLAQKVPNLNSFSIVHDVNINGEVRIDQAQLVVELPPHTRDHVVHVAAHSTDRGLLLGLTQPHVNYELFSLGGVHDPHVNGHVTEVPVFGNT